MIDAHSHIHYSGKIDDEVTNAKNQGVKALLNIHIIERDPKYSQTVEQFYGHLEAIEKVENFRIFLGAGVHPLGVSMVKSLEAQNILEKLMPKLTAIGETGLDLFKDDNKSEQLSFLEMHCHLSQEYNKPLVIHCRGCDVDDVLNITKNYNIKVMFHCWTFGVKELEKALVYNTMISFSGIVTFDKTENIVNAARICPLDRMLIETDSPYLSPVPFRGKKNQPAFIYETYKYISNLKSISFETLENQIESNFLNFFQVSL